MRRASGTTFRGPFSFAKSPAGDEYTRMIRSLPAFEFPQQVGQSLIEERHESVVLAVGDAARRDRHRKSRLSRGDRRHRLGCGRIDRGAHRNAEWKSRSDELGAGRPNGSAMAKRSVERPCRGEAIRRGSASSRRESASRVPSEAGRIGRRRSKATRQRFESADRQNDRLCAKSRAREQSEITRRLSARLRRLPSLSR